MHSHDELVSCGFARQDFPRDPFRAPCASAQMKEYDRAFITLPQLKRATMTRNVVRPD